MDITINPILKNLIRPLTDEEYAGLETSILRDGIREPLAVWDNGGKTILLDGHNRKRICDKHGLDYKTRAIKKVTVSGEERDLDSVEMAELWVLDNQLGRRNITQEERLALALQYHTKEVAVTNTLKAQKAGEQSQKSQQVVEKKGSNSVVESTTKLKSLKSTGYENKKEQKKQYIKTAAKAGVPQNMLAKAIAVSKVVPNFVADLAAGKTTLKAGKEQVKAVKDNAKATIAKKAAEEAPGEATIYTEDCVAFLKRYDKGSIDLLFTDPPYSTDVDDINKFVKMWLLTALSKVKDTGRAFIFVGAYPEELQAYLNTSLPTQLLVWRYDNAIGPMPKKDHVLNYQCILYYEGPKVPDWTENRIVNLFAAQTHNAPDGRQGIKFYKWEKPIDLAKQIIARSTKQGDVIIDPFAGSGTHLLASALLGRKSYGCDYDKKVVKIALERGCKQGE